MTELKATGLVHMHDSDPGEYNAEKEIHLKPEFEWFLSDKFAELRGLKEKHPPRIDTESPYDYPIPNDINEKLVLDRENPLEQNGDLRGEHSSFNQNIIQYSCNYCKFETDNQQAYNKHTVIKHQRKAGYPDRNGRTG